MNHPTDYDPKTDAKAPHTTLQAAFDATAQDADQAALDRLLRHTRKTVAEPAKKGLGLHWGWIVGPMAAAGAAAALTLATPTTETTDAGALAVAVEPDALAVEVALAEVLADESDVDADSNGGVDGDAMVAALDPSANGENGEWFPPGDDELGDDEELEAWIAAYEVVLAGG